MVPGSPVTVVISVPRGSFVKHDDHGEVDFRSPFPSLFNYGSVPGRMAADGDAQDALVLGPLLRRGEHVDTRVWGVVRFVDAGAQDDKWICGDQPPNRLELRLIRAFFSGYSAFKRVLNRVRGEPGLTAYIATDLY